MAGWLSAGRNLVLSRKVAGTLLILLAGSVVGWTVRGHWCDDAMIVFRYAQNLAEGEGWTYNPGEIHNGSTSPLYTLMVAVSGKAFGNYPMAGYWLSAVCLILAAVLAYRLLEFHGYYWGGLFSGFYLATNPLLWCTMGLESSMFLLFCVAAALAASGSRWKWAFAMGTLATLTRADGILLLACLYGFHCYQEKRLLLWPIAGSLILASPWLIFSTLTFGSPLPATLGAKMAQGNSGLWGGSFPFLRYAWILLRQPLYGSWSTLLPFFLGIPGLFFAPPAILLLVIAAGAQALLYGLIQAPSYHWYYAPVLFSAIILTGIALQRASKWLPAKLAFIPFLLASGLIAFQLSFIPTVAQVGAPNYVEVGKWLRKNTLPGQSVAAFEVGTIGWYSGLRVVDPFGLVTPNANQFVRNRDTAWWLERYLPDYIILHRNYWRDMEGPVIQHPVFKNRYEEALFFGEAGSRQIVLYRRQPGYGPRS